MNGKSYYRDIIMRCASELLLAHPRQSRHTARGKHRTANNEQPTTNNATPGQKR